jgi:hypothetical protein
MDVKGTAMNDSNVTEMEAHLRDQRDNLFAERNIVVAMLSKVFPSVLAYHSADENGDDGANGYDGYVVYILLPTGQISFHIGSDVRSSWFEHLQVSNIPVWDHHDSDTKWERVVAYLNGEVS